MALPSFGLKMLVKKSCSFCHRRFLCEESAFDLPGKPRPSGCILGPAHVTDTQGWALWVALWWLQVVTICYRKIGRTCGSSPFSWNDITMIWQFDIHKNPEAMVVVNDMIHLWQLPTCHWGWKSVALKLLGHPSRQWRFITGRSRMAPVGKEISWPTR